MVIYQIDPQHRKFFYFPIFFMIITLAACEGNKSVKDLKEVISENISSTISAKNDIITTSLKEKESTTVYLNTTVIPTTVEHKEKVKDKFKEKEKPDEEEPQIVPEKVEPEKPIKPELKPQSVVKPPQAKIDNTNQEIKAQSFAHPGRTLILFIAFLFVCYIIIHNKKKIMGLIVEGRTGRSNGRRGGNVRYRRLNTDEATVETGIE